MSDMSIIGLGICGAVIYPWLMFIASDLSVCFTGDIWPGLSVLLFITGAVLAYVGALK